MPRTFSLALSALFVLFALSALSAQQETAPGQAAGRPNAPRKQVHPNIAPEEAQAAAHSDNRRGRTRRPNPAPANRPAAHRAHGNAPIRVKERNPENPVRFAFAPRGQKQESASLMPWDANPSAGAVMSTFLTGEISPELVSWHVNQRKKALYEKRNAAQPVSSRSRAAAHPRSEYGEMLHRMEFAWGNRTPGAGERAGLDDIYGEEYYTDPSSGSILVQLLTGYKNGEIEEWKENQTLTARRSAPRGLPSMPAHPAVPPMPMYAAAPPLPQGMPLPARMGYAYTAARAAAGNIRRPEFSAMPGGTDPIRVAAAEEPRFVDDGFPAGTAAPHRSPIRQVSAEFRTPVPRNVLGQGERASRAGQIRVYSEDEDGWSPAE